MGYEFGFREWKRLNRLNERVKRKLSNNQRMPDVELEDDLLFDLQSWSSTPQAAPTADIVGSPITSTAPLALLIPDFVDISSTPDHQWYTLPLEIAR